MRIKAAVYTRVSTNEQTKGYSLPTQARGCKEYALSHGLEVVAVINDDISGATQLSDREGGQQLLSLVDNQEIQAVIVWRLDRLSRPPEGEYSRLLTTIEYLARHGVSVHDCETGEVKKDMASIMIAFFKGLAASQERSAIRERTMRGIEAKAREGKWIGQGDAPYGYKKVGIGREAYLKIDPKRAAIVKRIFDLYVGNIGRPLSFKQIAVLLTQEGVTSPGQVKRGGRRGKGGWYTATVSKRIINNPNYIGVFTAQGYTIHMPELAIIDEEIWKAAQERKERNRLNSSRNQKRKYLLSGRLTCICGAKMQGESKKRRAGGYNVYYRCQKHRYAHLVGACPVNYVRTDLLEPKVWEWLTELLTNPANVEEGLGHMTEESNIQASPLREELEIVDDLLNKVNRKIERIVAAFSDEEDDVTAEALRKSYKEKAELKISLEKQRQNLVAQLNQLELSPSLINEIITITTKIATLLPTGSYAKRRHILDVLNVKVQLQEGNTAEYAIRVSCYLKKEPMLIELCGHRFKSGCPDRYVKRPFPVWKRPFFDTLL